MARGSCTRSISAVISRTFFGLETSRRWGSRGCTLTSSTHRAFWPSQGQYTLADGEPTENQSMAEAGKLVPDGTIRLLRALRFHKFTTESPYDQRPQCPSVGLSAVVLTLRFC